MFVCKSISNIKVVVQPGTVQGFTKHKTPHYTGDNRDKRGEAAERGREKEERRKHNKGGEEEESG